MDSLTLKKELDKGKKFNIFDIRVKERYDTYHLDGAININMNELIQSHDNYLDKTQKYYVVCNSGNSSSFVEQVLRQLGFDIESLEGGMNLVLSNL